MPRTTGSSKRISTQDSKNENEVYIRTKLDGDSARQFETIQKENNFITYAETLRYIVNQSFKSVRLELNADLRHEIERLINNRSIRIKHSFRDKEDFINRAIIHYVNKIKEDMDSLADWDFRSTLSDEQRQVAIAILKVQIDEKKLTGVLVDDLVKETDFSPEKISKILEYFVTQDLVVVTTLKNKKYYSAVVLS
ncbi:MAG: hypothetical protein ACTSW1_02835 [Candidatus Hodarchaeales archaeon]